MSTRDQLSLRGLRTGTEQRQAVASPSTPHQRLKIRTQLQALELDTRRVTLFHRRFWLNAGLAEAPLGVDLDSVLCALTKAQASALITELSKEDSNA